MQKVEKTKAELLVGKWKLIKTDNQPAAATIVYEFTKDGKYYGSATGPTVPPQKRSGTYRLDGNVIRLSIDANADEPAETSDLVIEVLTETELVFMGISPRDRQHCFCKRVTVE